MAADNHSETPTTVIRYDIRKCLGFPGLQGHIGKLFAVTLHHTVTPSPLRKTNVLKVIDQMNEHHKALGWGGLGYHYVIDRLGRIYYCRSTYNRGAHTGRHNTGNIGIAVLGDYSNKRPSLRQRRAIRKLVTDLNLPYLRGHQEWADNATACPGQIMWYVKYLRVALKKRG